MNALSYFVATAGAVPQKTGLYCRKFYGILRQHCLTVGPWADVKNDFTWKIIIVLKVRDGHGE